VERIDAACGRKHYYATAGGLRRTSGLRRQHRHVARVDECSGGNIQAEVFETFTYGNISLSSGRGATGCRGQLTPNFRCGVHITSHHITWRKRKQASKALDPSLFVVFTCAQSVAVLIDSFIRSVIVVQLTTDNDRSKRSEVEVE